MNNRTDDLFFIVNQKYDFPALLCFGDMQYRRKFV